MQNLEFTTKEKEYFDYFIKKFGEPFVSTPVNETIINKYRGILPDLLLKYWKYCGFCGFCGFSDGLFWFTNPDDYVEVLKAWLPEEVLAEKPHFVVARTAWGKLIVWEPTYGKKYTIDPVHGHILLGKNNSNAIKRGEADSILENIIVFQNIKSLRMIIDDKIYFDYAIKKFGALKENEMFTFVPAVFMGGQMKMEDIRKVDLFIQLDILGQMAEPPIIGLKELGRMAFGQ